MENKTVKQWFEELPEGELRAKLLRKMDAISLGDLYYSLGDAVLYGTTWDGIEGNFLSGAHDALEGHETSDGHKDYLAGYNLAKETMEGQDV